MSQIEPYYDYSQFPPDDEEDFDPMQMRGGSNWQPGWRPPFQQRPPHGPPWPPGPGAGGWPFWGYWGFRLRSAWRDVKFLNKLIGDIVNEMIDEGLVLPGPNAPTTGPGSGTGTGTGTTAIKGPITGVTDGSDAAAGQVGEYISGSTDISFSAYPQITTTVVSPLVVQPGDWDLSASMLVGTTAASVPFAAASIILQPVPTGMSNNMRGEIGSYANSNAQNYGMVIGQNARGSFSIATPLLFSVQINQNGASSLPAGTATLLVQGRRRR